MAAEPIVDRDFADRFLRAVDRPLAYSVYQLFHDWWAEAPESAIDEYRAELLKVDGAAEYLEQRFLSEPMKLDDLDDCVEGSLGHAYRMFLVDNNLEVNLATNYRDFNSKLQAEGTLDRLPEDLCYMIVRGFQIHDFLHVITGHPPSIAGELGMAGFHYGQLKFPYHSMRTAVTTAYIAFVNPAYIDNAMDALSAGWLRGRAWENLHFVHWEDEINTPLESIREKYGRDVHLPAVV